MGKNEFDLDEGSIDNEDFNFDDIPGIGNDSGRSPVAKFASGFTDGVKDKPFDNNFIEQVLRQSLPAEYGQAITAGQAVKGRLDALVHKSADRGAPILKDAKSIGRNISDLTRGKIPPNITRVLDKISKDDTPSSNTTSDLDEIDNSLRSIFDQSEARKRVLDGEREKRDHVRSRITHNKIEATNEYLSRLAGYQDTVTYHYQRKSLELRYKSYFVLKEQLEKSTSGTDKLLKALETITHNTAMPEAVKIQNMEMFGMRLKERFIERIQNSDIGGINGLIEKLYSGAERKISEGIDTASMLFSSVELGTSMAGMMDPSEMAGMIAADKAADIGGAELGRRLHGRLSKNKRIQAMGHRLGSFLNNPTGYVNTLDERLDDGLLADSDDDSKLVAGLKSAGRYALRVGKDLTGTATGSGLKFGDQFEDYGDPAVFDKRTYRTQNEVVPGFLSRILREITSLRTGKEEPLTTFNFQRGKFTTAKTLSGDLKGRLGDAAGSGAGLRDINSFVDKVDDSGQLSKDAREAFKRQMILNTNSGMGFTPYALMREDQYTANMSDATRSELVSFFEANYTTGALGDTLELDKKINDLTLDATTIGRYFNPVMDEIQLQLAVGNLPYLESMGIIKDNEVDPEAVIDLILDTQGDGGDEPTPERTRETIQSLVGKAKDKLEGVRKGTKGLLKDTYDEYMPESAKQTIKGSRTIRKANVAIKRLQTDKGRKAMADEFRNNIAKIRDPEERKRILESAEGFIDDKKELARYQAWLMKNSDEYRKAKGIVDDKVNRVTSDPRVQQARAKAQKILGDDRVVDAKAKAEAGLKSIRLGIDKLKTEEGRKDLMDQATQVIDENIQKVKDPEERTRLIEAVKNDPKVQRTMAQIERVAQPMRIGNKLNGEATHEDLINELRKKASTAGPADLESTTQMRAVKPDDLDEDNIFRMSLDTQRELLEETREIKEIITDQLALIASGASSEGTEGGRRYGLRYGLRSAAGKLISGGSSLLGGYFSLAGGMTKLGVGAVGAGLRGGKGILNALMPKHYIGAKDIYVRGEKLPRLYARYLKEGRYITQDTGKVVRSVKDIERSMSPIVDSANPEDIILDVSDIQRGIHDVQGKPLIKNVANKLVDFYAGVLSPIPATFRLAKRAIGGFKDVLFNAVDVYLPDEAQPRLTKHLMSHGYYRSGVSGKVIRSHKDIDGPVYDIEHNEVLSAKDINKGLVDVNGNQLKTNMAKLASFAKSALGAALWPAKMGVKIIKAGLVTGAKVSKGLLKAITSPFRRVRSRNEFDVTAQSESLSYLAGIYEVLDERLPGKRRKVLGDRDGDGIRDGSARDQRRKAKSKAEGKIAQAKEAMGKVKGKGVLGGISAAIASLLGKGANAEEEDGDIYAGSLDLGGDGDDRSKSKGKGKMPKGKLAKAKHLAGKGLRGLLGFGGSALKLGGRLALGATALAGASATGILAGLGAAAGTALSVLASPVVLGAIAVGAAAYGGYRFYKYMKGKKRDELYLTRFRMAQYGVDWSQEDPSAAVLALEERLLPKVKISPEGGELDMQEDDLAFLLKTFNVPTDDDDRVRRCFGWFKDRFKPVFLLNVALARSKAPDTKFLEIDTLPAKTQLEILEGVTFDGLYDSPYQVYLNPWGGTLGIGPGEVNDTKDLVKAELVKLRDKEGKEKPKGRRVQRARKAIQTAEHTAIAKIRDDYNERQQRRRGGRKTTKSDTEKRQAEAAKQRTKIQEQHKRDHGILDKDGYLLPTAGRISSPYGNRVHPISGDRTMHKGMDFAAPAGTPVYATADGTIIRREYSNSYGYVIYIHHGGARTSRYAHLSRFADGHDVGSKVAKGELIGYVGNTGRSAGNHLHFEIRDKVGGKFVPIDPLLVMGNKETKAVKDEIKAEEALLKEDKDPKTLDLEGHSTIASTAKGEATAPPKVVKAPAPKRAPVVPKDLTRRDLDRKHDEAIRVQKAILETNDRYQQSLGDSIGELVRLNTSMDATLKSLLDEVKDSKGVSKVPEPTITKAPEPVREVSAHENRVTYKSRRQT